MKSTEIFRWYVFYTKPRFEKKIHEKLIKKGLESYLPLIRVLKQWSDRKKRIEEPLFKSYIFAHVNEKGRLQVLETDGIVRCVSFNGRLATVPDWQIDYIKKLVSNKSENLKIEDKIYEKGTKVRVISGPLSGLEGIIEYVSEDKWIVFNVEAVNKSIKVRLSLDEVIQVINEEPEIEKPKFKYRFNV